VNQYSVTGSSPDVEPVSVLEESVSAEVVVRADDLVELADELDAAVELDVSVELPACALPCTEEEQPATSSTVAAAAAQAEVVRLMAHPCRRSNEADRTR
jgi:hypothetical protein